MPNKNNQKTSKLQQWLENIWYNKGTGKFLLVPLTALYCSINSFQRFQHRHSKTKLPCPVIVVGNITVGGTGKTPLTIYIVKLLQKAGYKPAIITRGYGGKAKTWPQSVTENSDSNLVGDEAVLMASRTQVPVYAGADRLQSIEVLSQARQEHECDVIVSDDGMQHYKLPRDIQIAVLDGARMLGNGWCLPSGPLRERKQRLKACDLLVVNGEIVETKKDDLQAMPFFTMNLKGSILTNLVTGEQQTLDIFAYKKVRAVTGIGNPQRFFNTLEKQGDLQLNTYSFPDHHDFVEADFNFSDDLPVIMTEKDAVKCQKFAKNNFWSLPITAELDNDFEKALLRFLKG
jgi:tetraacyldisaccharide 4'-kinase